MNTPSLPMELCGTAIDPSRLHRFSVANFRMMFEKGVFKANEQIEMLEGRIVHTRPHKRQGLRTISRIARALAKLAPACWRVQIHELLTLADSAAKSDIAIVRCLESRTKARKSELGNVLEVADASLIDDRRYKGELYAKAKIAEFWLVNLVERKIEVYTKPRGSKYHKTIEYHEKQTVPLVLDGTKIADLPVCELLARS